MALLNLLPTRLLLVLSGRLLLLLLAHTALSKKFSNKGAECSPYPYPFLEHGKITSTGPQKYSFQCHKGYFLTGSRKVRCWKGKWSDQAQPKCLKSEGYCDDPPPFPGGRVLGEGREVGSTIQYMCDPGFVMMGEARRHCISGGYWSGITPACMDEKEPMQKVGQRLKEKFVTEMASHSSDSAVPEARLLDRDSIQHGLELVILIDRSSSIEPEDFKIGIRFLKFLLHNFGVRNGNNTSGTRVAVLTFGSDVEILFNLDNITITGTAAANRALDTIKADGGGTAMEEAFMFVFTSLPPLRQGAKRALFMITDGEPNAGTLENTQYFATELKKKENFEIFTIGVGRGINRQVLSSLASEPLINHVFILDKYSDLKSIMETIKDVPVKPKIVSPLKCGYVKHEEHFLRKWPWLGAVYTGFPTPFNISSLGFCAGTLICQQWLITAASCFFRVDETDAGEKEAVNSTQEVFVVLGEKDVIKDDRTQLNFYAEDVIIHPEFDPLHQLLHNVALIKLNAPAPTGHFRPACLPPSSRTVLLHSDLDTNASIAGWGRPPSPINEVGINGGTVRFHATNVTAVIEEENVCSDINGRYESQGNFFCAGSGSHTCIGDFGSPIIAVDGTTHLHHLIGVLGGRSHCHKGINEYAELTKYIRWIDDTTKMCHLKHTKDR